MTLLPVGSFSCSRRHFALAWLALAEPWSFYRSLSMTSQDFQAELATVLDRRRAVRRQQCCLLYGGKHCVLTLSELVDFTIINRSAPRLMVEAGYAATWNALKRAPWHGKFDPIEGVIIHEELAELPSAAEEPQRAAYW